MVNMVCDLKDGPQMSIEKQVKRSVLYIIVPEWSTFVEAAWEEILFFLFVAKRTHKTGYMTTFPSVTANCQSRHRHNKEFI